MFSNTFETASNAILHVWSITHVPSPLMLFRNCYQRGSTQLRNNDIILVMLKTWLKVKKMWNNSTCACIPSTRRACAGFFLEIFWQKVVFSLGGLCLKDFTSHNVFSSKPRITIGSELPGPGKQVRWQSAWLACNHENLHWIPRTRKKKKELG